MISFTFVTKLNHSNQERIINKIKFSICVFANKYRIIYTTLNTCIIYIHNLYYIKYVFYLLHIVYIYILCVTNIL